MDILTANPEQYFGTETDLENRCRGCNNKNAGRMNIVLASVWSNGYPKRGNAFVSPQKDCVYFEDENLQIRVKGRQFGLLVGNEYQYFDSMSSLFDNVNANRDRKIATPNLKGWTPQVVLL